MRLEPPPFDPEPQGQWVHAIANLSGEEKARPVALEIDGQHKGHRYQKVVDLAERRGYPLAVIERAAELLR